MIVVFIVVTLMTSLIILASSAAKQIKFEEVSIDLPDDVCDNLFAWYQQILAMQEGREKWVALKKYNDHVLSLGNEEKGQADNVVSLSNYK